MGTLADLASGGTRQGGTAFAYPRKPASAAWYLVALGVAVVGLLAAMGWGVASVNALDGRMDGYPRGAVPGSVTVDVSEPGRQIVYYEGAGDLPLAMRDLRVTAPGGRQVPAATYQSSLRYERQGRTGRTVATFQAERAGTYRVGVAGDAGSGQGARMAVGDGFGRMVSLSLAGSVALAVVTMVAALVVALGVRTRRRPGGAR